MLVHLCLAVALPTVVASMRDDVTTADQQPLSCFDLIAGNSSSRNVCKGTYTDHESATTEQCAEACLRNPKCDAFVMVSYSVVYLVVVDFVCRLCVNLLDNKRDLFKSRTCKHLFPRRDLTPALRIADLRRIALHQHPIFQVSMATSVVSRRC